MWKQKLLTLDAPAFYQPSDAKRRRAQLRCSDASGVSEERLGSKALAQVVVLGVQPVGAFTVEGKEVILIFSVHGSGQFQGYAVLQGPASNMNWPTDDHDGSSGGRCYFIKWKHRQGSLDS
ncbi:hypothetical protein HPB52_016613 [Rhipicephalus sanguineus]|uniref:YTH domain-containing protein n=1 Tax=Rhipicephalus sanguineus TaxID=34632 RepID=A0A9D4Q0Z9_RHISA|nr:hypothetical protein HPB52_016613 [Rhipicephalus sanguineus]